MSKSYKNKKEGQHYDLKVIHDASKDKHDCKCKKDKYEEKDEYKYKKDKCKYKSTDYDTMYP
ncbi:hypothetical protein COJ90_02520 [Priestia megaterium]|uniref:hypothetical protein n=1 Tax=Priestia megaterium TaxID=1404 RepID=UPI000BFA1105|nr:hypothetical protein [Priestia megaterium]PFP15904.1 hypothetical protein COJ90_02520 [Priestia megaterium]